MDTQGLHEDQVIETRDRSSKPSIDLLPDELLLRVLRLTPDGEALSCCWHLRVRDE